MESLTASSKQGLFPKVVVKKLQGRLVALRLRRSQSERGQRICQSQESAGRVMAAFETHRDSDAAADMLTEQELDMVARDGAATDQGRRGHVGSNWFLTMVSTLLVRSCSPVRALVGGACFLPWLHGSRIGWCGNLGCCVGGSNEFVGIFHREEGWHLPEF